MSTQPAASEVPPMPRGIRNFYYFDLFNTTSWTVVLGAPMLLFLQHLQATATILAVAASLSPLLVTLQIPAARHVERVGYRRFALNGFSSRSFFLIGMAVVAFLPESIDRTTRIVLMLFLSFFYNIIRGISSCSMLPWATHIVPEQRRGEFVARDQAANALSTIGSLLLYALVLRGTLAWYSFGIVFSTGAVAAFISLVFMKRIPDVPVEKIPVNPNPLPWREMLLYPPFLRYLRYNLVMNMALGASGVFWVRYFRTFLHVNNSNSLLIACATNAVLTVTLLLVTPLLDRTGNKPVLTLAGVCLAIQYGIWAAVAAGLFPFNFAILSVQVCLSGVGGALWAVGNIRAVMNIIPAMGRPHFLAIYSVISSLTVAIVPLLWGPVIDALESWRVAWGFWTWNNYSVLYSTLAVTIVAGTILLRGVTEPVQMTWDVFARELFIFTPSRALSRVIGRLRSIGTG